MKTLKNILKIKTFIVLISMMTLTALYAGVFASSPTAFKDVPVSYWGYKNIERAYTDGVVSGTDYNEKNRGKKLLAGSQVDNGAVYYHSDQSILC